jgi:micrococcal nuclease
VSLRSHRYNLLTRFVRAGGPNPASWALPGDKGRRTGRTAEYYVLSYAQQRGRLTRATTWLLVSGLAFAFACRSPSPATPEPLRSSGRSPQGPVEVARVLRVVDGDTIEIQRTGGRARVRYIGMNTPESVAPDRPIECFGKEASERNRALVEGREVRLEKDVSDTDRFGRLLRYVWLDDVLINARLVEEGYAEVSTFPPDVKYQSLFTDLQQSARQQSRGLWAECPPRRERN